jgi:signal transduction histidine kinase
LSVLQNAAEAIDAEGTITVTARTDGEKVVVEVSDDGRGIHEDLLDGVFEIGFGKQSGRIGMQLGLPMSKRHLDEIGGSIAIESGEGTGTKVRITVSAGEDTT